mgnify:CR=1 FL=1
MREFVDHPECAELIDALRPLASTVLVKDAHWICTPDGEYTHSVSGGSNWCRDCARAIVRHLRKKDRNRERRSDYILDGGWPTEHETPPFCAHCGARLDAILLSYGALEELDHFRENPPTPWNAGEAYEISEMLSAFEVTGPDDSDFVAEAVAIATKLVEAMTLTPEPE